MENKDYLRLAGEEISAAHGTRGVLVYSHEPTTGTDLESV